MSRNNLYKLGLIVAISAFCLFLSYPPSEQINLGLDLRGGIHLVLDVVVEEAVAGQVRTDMGRFQDLLEDEGVVPSETILDSDVSFSMTFNTELLRDQAEVNAINYYPSYNVNLSSNPPTLNLSLDPDEQDLAKDAAVRQALQTIRNRIDQFGVAEPVIQRQGMAGTRILVQLPGAEDPERVKNLLRTSAILQFRLVQAGPAETREALVAAAGGQLPAGTEIVESIPETVNGVEIPPMFYLLDIVPIVEGGELKDARLSQDEFGLPAIGFTLEATSAQKFGEFTSTNIGRLLAIVLDDRVQQAPSIESRIDGDGIIRGQFTLEEAEDRSLMLRSGALPASIEYLEDRSVGPSLGRESIRQGVLAAIIGMSLVVAFMLVYYKGAGINAVLALALNLIIVMGVMASLQATLTLPGIAGLILLIGMSVDANVLIFERIREELDLGKTVRSSIDAGFSKAFSAILDANLTTLIAAAFLFQFGTGPVKGFAVTITIGIVASMFTALFVSRVIFAIWTSTRRQTLSI
ncbi:MAG: protein translocase subunit SecD [Acidobacteria bacterium]|jgi:preprotein translocase subunit SecD|nr:protein translocase subunit SecD [Acidobacteriota bacterium]|tara:strand:- start:224 stop:1786 length:1563 start_codon:yes stop_codon:yes gene_type:complete